MVEKIEYVIQEQIPVEHTKSKGWRDVYACDEENYNQMLMKLDSLKEKRPEKVFKAIKRKITEETVIEAG